MQYTPYTIPLLLSAGFTLFVALWGLRRRHAIGAIPFVVLMFAMTGWTTGYAFELAAVDVADKVLWARIQYLFIVIVPISTLVFLSRYAGRTVFLEPRVIAVLSIIPLITAVFAWTNDYHGLIWSEIILDTSQSFTVLVLPHGAFFWVIIAYSYILLLIGTALLIQSVINSPRLYRTQGLTILVGVVAPWTASILFVSNVNPFPQVDLTPFAFTITGLVGGWALFRYRLLDLLPLAHSAVTRSMTDGVVVLDDQNRIVDINTAAEHMFRISARDNVGKAASDAFHHPHLITLLELSDETQTETELPGDCETRQYEIHSSPIFDERRKPRGQLFVFRDITEHKQAQQVLRMANDELELRVEERTNELKQELTERKRLEEQLIQAQKMEAIGQLAGGVAHDFNNILSAIMSYNQLIQLGLAPPEPWKTYLDEIEKSADRAAELTRQLLAFSRRQLIEPRVLNINDLVLNMDSLLRRLIGEDIEMVMIFDPDLWAVRADLNQMEQVIMNLVVNAKDAMPNGGKLIIQTSNFTANAAAALSHPDIAPGDFALITVSDAGVGIPEEIKTRVFDPFFTTKDIGKGSGLGLATCYGIIQQNGGAIVLDSKEGEGTTFQIFLPRNDADADTQLTSYEPQTLSFGSETILLVEDEPNVRQIAAITLRERGYTVIEAANGEEALRFIQRDPQEIIHLLLTDVVMPLMSGTELAEAFKRTRPDTKILYTSGYTDDSVIRYGLLENEVEFIRKPYTPQSLTRKVRELLDG